jgi:1-acyl-sn-glycerol-3-phosphate acyltransferase
MNGVTNQTMHGLGRRAGYWLTRRVMKLLFELFSPVRVVGFEHLPACGGLLVVYNHGHIHDAGVLMAALPRPVEFMGAVEFFRRPVWGRFAHWLGSFPVDRGRKDPAAVRQAVRRLRQGRCVAIAPEGTVRSGAQSLLAGHVDLKPGAGAIALLANAAVLPVILRRIERARGRLRRFEWQVKIFPPFCPWSAGLRNGERRAAAADLIKTQLLDAIAVSGNGSGEHNAVVETTASCL